MSGCGRSNTIIFLGLFGISLYSTASAELLAEVEPFKTSIVLKFAREWPFVVYALTLLAAGRFVERFFCRYLCPLGAALAIAILDAAQYTPPSLVYSFPNMQTWRSP